MARTAPAPGPEPPSHCIANAIAPPQSARWRIEFWRNSASSTMSSNAPPASKSARFGRMSGMLSLVRSTGSVWMPPFATASRPPGKSRISCGPIPWLGQSVIRVYPCVSQSPIRPSDVSATTSEVINTDPSAENAPCPLNCIPSGGVSRARTAPVPQSITSAKVPGRRAKATASALTGCAAAAWPRPGRGIAKSDCPPAVSPCSTKPSPSFPAARKAGLPTSAQVRRGAQAAASVARKARRCIVSPHPPS